MSIKAICYAVLLWSTLSVGGKPAGVAGNQLTFEPISQDIVGTQPYVERSSNRGVLILNAPDRVIHLVRDGHLFGSFGGFGTGPGEFYNPVIAANKSYVVDVEWTTQRIQWFAADGTYLHTCHLASSLDTRTAALTDDNVLLLNDSHNATPIVLMDDKCNIVKGLGSRIKASELYGTTNVRKDAEYKDASNRVDIAADATYVYVAYWLAPVISKFDRAGHLLFRTSLNHAIDGAFWKYSPDSGGLSTGVDGTQIPYITRGISIDPITHKIWVLAAEDLKEHVALYCISQDGKVVLRLPLTSPVSSGDIQGMAVYNNVVYLSLVYAHGVYVSPLPST